MGRCEESVHCNKMHSVAFGLFFSSVLLFMIFFFLKFSAFSSIASVKVNDDYQFPL